jgi:hypothetical protein
LQQQQHNHKQWINNNQGAITATTATIISQRHRSAAHRHPRRHQLQNLRSRQGAATANVFQYL